jgi:Tfp pilus assembly protein PilW
VTIPVPSFIPNRPPGRAFTLVEVMIGSTLASFILLAVMSTFLFLGRSSASIQNYNDLDAQARQALELFAEDTRQASAVTWVSSAELHLTVNGVQVRYYYTTGDATLYRRVTADGAPQALVTGITRFAFNAYSITGSSLALTSASDLITATNSTKQLQVFFVASRQRQTAVDATNRVVSARFILRNKRVTA